MSLAYLLAGVLIGLGIAWTLRKLGRDQTEQELDAERATVVSLKSDVARFQAELTHRDATISQYRADLDNVEERFKAAFENLANRIFDESAVKLKRENTNSLAPLLNPLRDQIIEFRQRVDAIYNADTSDRSALRQQVEQLTVLNQQVTTEAKNLTVALKGQAQAQGAWGELILETILEKSALLRDFEYSVRSSFTSPDGKRAIPDVIINLPDAKHIVLDAKVSLTAYDKYCSSKDGSEQDIALKEHLASIKKHVKELSGKNYAELYQITSPDFVLMFIPIESAFSVAWRAEPNLVSDTYDSNVIMVTTSTLMATLRTIKNIWTREKQARNVLEIARQGGALYDQFARFYDDLSDLGQHLRKAEDAYNSARDRLKTGKGNLIRRVEELRKLGARASKSLPLDLIQEADDGPDLLSDSAESAPPPPPSSWWTQKDL
jgi:DNA recombination protein RmuC